LSGESRFELPVRLPHQLGSVPKSCSLFVATAPSYPKAGALTRLRYSPNHFTDIHTTKTHLKQLKEGHTIQTQ